MVITVTITKGAARATQDFEVTAIYNNWIFLNANSTKADQYGNKIILGNSLSDFGLDRGEVEKIPDSDSVLLEGTFSTTFSAVKLPSGYRWFDKNGNPIEIPTYGAYVGPIST